MHARTTTAALAAALLLTTLSACGDGGTKPDAAACKVAMTKQFKKAMAAGDDAKPGTRPAACDGVDDKTLKRITGEIMSGALKDAGQTATQ